MEDRLNGVHYRRQDGLEKSRFFNRTAPLHDQIFYHPTKSALAV
jgi:hypothetical protein